MPPDHPLAALDLPKPGPGAAPRAAPGDRWNALLLLAAVLLPLLLTGGGAWVSWRQAWREAATETAHVADVAAEYARRVFDGLLLRVDRAEDLLAGLSDAEIRAREPQLHAELKRVATAGRGPESATDPYIFVFDRDAVPLVSGVAVPVPRDSSLIGREFNQALRGPDAAALHVSPVYVGSVTRAPFFAITRRRARTGNDLPAGGYDGVINASVFVVEMELALQRLASSGDENVLSLIRSDGTILARSIPVPPGTRVAAGSPFLAPMARGEERFMAAVTSTVDGQRRIAAYRRVEGYPVYATAARPRAAVLRRWAGAAWPLLAAGLCASLALLALARLTLRQQRALAGTNAALEERVARRTAALAASELRLRAITDAMPQMVWSTRPDGFHDYFNRRWYELTGTTPEQAEGEGWNAILHPEDRERATGTWRHSLRTGEPYEVEYRLRMADGAYRWVLGRALPIRDARGEILRWFGTCTDIGEIVRARDVLTDSRAELERLVEARTQDLRQTQARLAHAQRMEALGQLAGGIAHDFNNVLQAVQASAALLQRRAADAASVRRLAAMVAEAAGRGAGVTRRLLAFARRGDLRTEAVDAAELLANLREILGHTLGTGIRIEVAADADLPPMSVDRTQLETVLVNLATNARDAMEGHGTLVFAAARDGRDRDSDPDAPVILQAGEYLRLDVADTGTGMTPEVLARASEPFFTTKPQSKGTGLGLAIARGFAEQSGGGFAIESEAGRGTVVRLWFPLAEGPAAVAAARLPPRPGRARLLLVEDDAAVRTAMEEELRALGFTVHAAADGAAALALLEGGAAVDLVVSDLSMPGMDGVALLRAIHRRWPRLPSILLTGFVTPAAEQAVGGALGGASTLLRKPIGTEELAERIDLLLGEPAPAG